MFKLVIQDDEGKTTVVPLIRDEITIGRKEGNTIRLTERNVSRRHARILRSDNEVQIEDLGSYNGIRVNNARIAERVSLRISDQVQIGDYKLYLKAEGLEQVDDARTMPIERVDTPPGEMPAAVPAAATLPTAPMPAQPRPQSPAMAVADTDPAGRPVATAAQVAALTAPAGYGKLVVTSSNFAELELDLTRPQMIIGRTDENDLVINHRSISRNHAKVTRDPETQRYTISDLQSSNGVRVNGQDYGKVELRRGDVVDLGHVRLRFVEPGEDFVFARDAVVEDMPEGGGKKGMLVAVVLAVVVLGAAVTYLALKPNIGRGGGGNDHVGAVKDSVASDNVVGSNGSNGSAVVVAIPTVEVDADVASVPVGSAENPELKRFEGDCLAATNDKRWTDLSVCAAKLEELKPGAGLVHHKRYDLEIRAQRQLETIKDALNEKLLKKAQGLLATFPPDSVYSPEATQRFNDEKSKLIAQGSNHVKELARNHDCAGLDTYIVNAKSSYGDEVGAQIAAAAKCDAAAVPPADCTSASAAKDPRCKKVYCATHGTEAVCGGAGVVAPPPQDCDKEKLLAEGNNETALNDHLNALKSFEAAFRCKADSHTATLAFMEACRARDSGRARFYWKKLSPESQNRYSTMCLSTITRDQLDAP